MTMTDMKLLQLIKSTAIPISNIQVRQHVHMYTALSQRGGGGGGGRGIVGPTKALLGQNQTSLSIYQMNAISLHV